jgi:signal transduction histidine kinase
MSTRFSTAGASLGTIGEASPLPFLAVDSDGRLTEWNPPADELLGDCVGAAGKPVAHEALRIVLDRAMAGESVRDEPVAWLRDDGVELELLVSAEPLQEGGEAAGAFAFALPVVDAPARVENVVTVGRIAHELNNVMTAISGYTYVLAKKSGDDDPNRREVERISEAATRALSISQRLAGLARRTASRTPTAS